MAGYIRQILPDRLVDLCEPLIIEAYGKQDFGYIKKVVLAFHDRLVLIPDIVPLSKYFFTDDFEYDPKGAEKYFKAGKAKEILGALKERLAKVEPFTKAKIEPVFKDLAKEMDVKLGVVIHPCRLALTGTLQSPPMYDVVEILGKKKVDERLLRALGSLKQ